MRHCDKVKIACRSNLANSFCGAVIETSPGSVLKRPSYYTMQMYATHALPLPLEASTSIEGLDVFACASERRDAVAVFVVNSKADPVNCTLSFDRFAEHVQTVAIETLTDQRTAREPDVMNHWDAPARVSPKTQSLTGNGITLAPLSVNVITCR
jgi:alpha-L-arabinofuranosidase